MFRSSLTALSLFTLIALLALGGCGDGGQTDGGKADDAGGKSADQAKDTDKTAGKDGKQGKKGPKDVPPGETVEVAFVTNNSSDFWAIARAGVEKAEKDFNANCDFRLPDGTVEDQKRIIEELIAKRVSGMAISPNDAENQVEMINDAAERMNVICFDSDAPKSNRRAYVGTNNIIAGREAGKLIKEVLPNGGKIMLFVGRLDAQNAIERKQGIEEALRGTDIEIIDTLTDGGKDRARAKANVEDTLSRHPDIGCLVGLWSYNAPQILSAVKGANKEGMIPIVAFDEAPDTLQGVADGYIHATVVQDPYNFGYKSVEVLAALARGETDIIPEDKLIEFPVRVIRQDNVAAFWAELKRLKAEQ